jgi:cell division protein FtsI (penicillin-binding protein 3)
MFIGIPKITAFATCVGLLIGCWTTERSAAASLAELIERDADGIGVVFDGSGRPADREKLIALEYIPASRVLGRGTIRLSLRGDVEEILTDELFRSIGKHDARSGFAFIMDVRTGEIVAMADGPLSTKLSKPRPGEEVRFNRLSQGLYEFGQVGKIVTTAMALDSGDFTLKTSLDLRHSLKYGKFSIGDHSPLGRVAGLEEAFLHSSNIAVTRMALSAGKDKHRAFLDSVGLTGQPDVDLLFTADPIVPSEWGQLNSMTVSFGHGIAFSPLQAGAAVAALVNGGVFREPRLTKSHDGTPPGRRIVSQETSAAIRYLLRQDVVAGSGQKADVPGLKVGGKAGTSEKAINGRYVKNRLLTSFVAVFPIDDPRYLVMTALDEPGPSKETHGHMTAGWNAAPMAGRIIERTAPVLGVRANDRLDGDATTSNIVKKPPSP